jgi:putative MATE family efflux protein
MKQDNHLMTEGVIWKQLLMFAIPLLIGNIFQQLYNAIDAVIVGNYVGSHALAAVGASQSIINLLIGFFTGIATGAGIVISQYFGANDENKLKQSVHTAAAFSLIAGILLTVIGVSLAPGILRIMGTPEDILSDASNYLMIYFCGVIFILVYNMGAGILRAVGDSKRPLYYLCCASIVNVILDLVFVIGFNLGVVGVAVATLIAQACSVCLLVRQLLKTKEAYRIEWRSVRIYPELFKKIIKVGLPTGIQQMIVSLSNAVVQSGINSFGAYAIAGCSNYTKIDGFIVLPIMSFAMASTTFTGQNIGAKQYDRVKKGIVSSLMITTIYTLSISLLVYLFGSHVLKIFSRDPEVLSYGTKMLRVLAPCQILLALMQVFIGTVRGSGKTLMPMVNSLVSLCLCRILWVKIFLYFVNDIRVVFWSYPFSWLIGLGLSSLYAFKGNWMPQQNKKIKSEDKRIKLDDEAAKTI